LGKEFPVRGGFWRRISPGRGMVFTDKSTKRFEEILGYEKLVILTTSKDTLYSLKFM